MKIIKAVSAGAILLIAITVVVVSIMTGQLTVTHAANLTAKPVLVSKQVTPQGTSTQPPNVPPQMNVPPGNILLAQIFGRGALAFACPATAQSAEVPMIVTSADTAGTQVIGTHFMDFAGLAWEGLNGDRVIAAPLVKVVVTPNSAPWVLLKATAHTGTGLFARVTFIERIFTVGGLPHACKNVGQAEEQVPFSTQYLLFGPASTT